MRSLAHKKFNRGKLAVAGTLMAFFLAACGGDDTNQGLFPQLTTLQIYSTNPQNGESDVAGETQIDIRFTEPVAQNSLTGRIKVISAASEQEVKGTLIAGQQGMLVTFRPASGTLPGNAQIIVDVLPGIQASSGRRFDESYRFSFDTGIGGRTTHSIPGQGAVLTQIYNANFVPSGQYNGERWVFKLSFNECVAQQEAQSAVRATSFDLLEIIQEPMDVEVVGDQYNDRTLYIFLYGNTYTGGRISFRFEGGMASDCDGDLIEKGGHKNIRVGP